MEFIPAKNFYRGRRSPRIKRIYIHSMEAPEKGTTAEAVARYFQTTDRKASSHYNFDNNSEVQSVRDEDTAFHMAGDNSASIGLEHAGYARQTREEWFDQFGVDMLEISAARCAILCRKHDIPPVFLDVVDLREDRLGISTHYNGSIAFEQSDHWDPGRGFPVDYYMERVNYYYTPVGDGDLTPEENKMLKEINLRLIRVQNAFDNPEDKTFQNRIVDPVQKHATELRNSLSSLNRRLLGVKQDKTDDEGFINWIRSKLP